MTNTQGQKVHEKDYYAFGALKSEINDGASDLKMMWVLMPGGLEDFFQAIGRPRQRDEAPPAPFARPENVTQIETGTVFAALDDEPTS